MDKIANFVGSLRKLDWGQFDLRFAPIFAIYGFLIASMSFSQLGWGGIVGGVGGALLGGYLIPGRSIGPGGQGPVINQIGTAVISGILGLAVAAFFVLR